MDKHLARVLIKEKLDKIQNKAFKEDKIYKSLINLNLNYESFFVYNSLKSEVDTKKIIDYLLEMNKTVYLPKIDNLDMFLVKIDKFSEYEIGPFNILEPKGEILCPESVKIDVAITPLLGFDNNLNRLGKGKGFYDRFFEKVDCFKIALAFSEQKVDKIDAQLFDVKMDLIITDTEILK